MIDSAHDLFLNHHAVELKLLFQHPARREPSILVGPASILVVALR
jgi:hypothetical protein